MLMENTDVHARTWGSLTNTETGRTLHLGPGEQADVDLPDEFTDTFLKPAKAKPPKKSSAPEPAADPDESKE